MSNLVDFAKRELEFAGMYEGDEYNKMVADAVMEIVQKFADQGHSGFSAGMAISILKKVLNYEPLSPLTGADDEWTKLDYDDHIVFQSKRCPNVFKNSDGRAYDSNGKIFRRPDGACYTSKDSRVYIEFPYTPKSEYIDVPE